MDAELRKLKYAFLRKNGYGAGDAWRLSEDEGKVMNPEVHAQRARYLRSQGFDSREIANVLGIGRGHAWALIADDEPTEKDPKIVKRIGHAEREQAVERLTEHYGRGHLELDELDERLAGAQTAKTQADLDLLFADMPDLPKAEPAPAPTPKSTKSAKRPRTRVLPLGIAIAVIAILSAMLIVATFTVGFDPILFAVCLTTFGCTTYASWAMSP